MLILTAPPPITPVDQDATETEEGLPRGPFYSQNQGPLALNPVMVNPPGNASDFQGSADLN
jgi:hypothetical protein